MVLLSNLQSVHSAAAAMGRSTPPNPTAAAVMAAAAAAAAARTAATTTDFSMAGRSGQVMFDPATPSTSSFLPPSPSMPAAVGGGGGGGGGRGGQFAIYPPTPSSSSSSSQFSCSTPVGELATRKNEILDRARHLQARGIVAMPQDPSNNVIVAGETGQTFASVEVKRVSLKIQSEYIDMKAKAAQKQGGKKNIVSALGRAGYISPYDRLRGEKGKPISYVPAEGQIAGTSHEQATTTAAGLAAIEPTTNNLQSVNNFLKLQKEKIEGEVWERICNEIGRPGEKDHPNAIAVAEDLFPRLAALAMEKPSNAYAHFNASEFPPKMKGDEERGEERNKGQPFGGRAKGGPADLDTMNDLSLKCLNLLGEITSFLDAFPQFANSTLYDVFQFMPTELFRQEKYFKEGQR